METTGELTIGAFARASRLSPKALRLYDELGLLAPARVDGTTGYRYYTEAQLERARLVAWLRRVGMPLARIGSVCDLYETDPMAAGTWRPSALQPATAQWALSRTGTPYDVTPASCCPQVLSSIAGRAEISPSGD